MSSSALAKQLKQAAKICAARKELADFEVARAEQHVLALDEHIAALDRELSNLGSAHLASLQGIIIDLDLAKSSALAIQYHLANLQRSNNERSDAAALVATRRRQAMSAAARSDVIQEKSRQITRRVSQKQEERSLAEISDRSAVKGWYS